VNFRRVTNNSKQHLVYMPHKKNRPSADQRPSHSAEFTTFLGRLESIESKVDDIIPRLETLEIRHANGEPDSGSPLSSTVASVADYSVSLLSITTSNVNSYATSDVNNAINIGEVLVNSVDVPDNEGPTYPSEVTSSLSLSSSSSSPLLPSDPVLYIDETPFNKQKKRRRNGKIEEVVVTLDNNETRRFKCPSVRNSFHNSFSPFTTD